MYIVLESHLGEESRQAEQQNSLHFCEVTRLEELGVARLAPGITYLEIEIEWHLSNFF